MHRTRLALVMLLACAPRSADAAVQFLPPLSAEPSEGRNITGLIPAVEITDIDSGSVVAAFAGAREVRATSRSHYLVTWHAGRSALEAGRRYRIRVAVDGVELGSTGILVGRGREARSLTGEDLAVHGNRTIPIKFRILAPPECATVEPPCRAQATCMQRSPDMGAAAWVPDGPGAGPNGVACADFDGDGHADVAVAKVYGANVTILLGRGNGTFLPPTSQATDPGPRGVVVADMNADGWSDVLTANHYARTVSVLDGRGDGTFEPARHYEATWPPGRAVQIAAGDLDGDGRLDVVTGNETGTISVLLGDGSGGLAPAVEHAAGIAPHGVTIADLDCDGHPDVAVADYGVYGTPGVVLVLLGTGDGGLLPAVSYDAGLSPWSVAVADFDRDGHQDLAVTNYGIVGSSSTVSVLRGLGGGMFGAPIDLPIGAQPYVSLAGDFDDDGLWDIAAGNSEDSTLSLFGGQGDGTFEPPRVFPVGGRCVGVASADLDGDGLLDFVTANGDDDNVSVVLNTSW